MCSFNTIKKSQDLKRHHYLVILKKAGKNYVNFLCKKKNPIKCNGNANLRHTIIKHISEKK